MAGRALKASERAPGLLLGDDVTIGDDVMIGGNVIIHAGVEIGDGARIGDHAQIRDRAKIGPGVTIGSFTSVDPEVEVGARTSVQVRCYLAAGSVIEEDCFVGPGVTFTNDNTMDRHPADTPLEGAVLRRACRIGAGTVICPGVEIGSEAFVAAGAVIATDIPVRGVAMGVPARVVRDVPEADLLEAWR